MLLVLVRVRAAEDEVAEAGEDLHVKDLLDAGRELEPGDALADLQIDDGHAAPQLVRPLADGEAAEDGRLPDSGQAD